MGSCEEAAGMPRKPPDNNYQCSTFPSHLNSISSFQERAYFSPAKGQRYVLEQVRELDLCHVSSSIF